MYLSWYISIKNLIKIKSNTEFEINVTKKFEIHFNEEKPKAPQDTFW